MSLCVYVSLSSVLLTPHQTLRSDVEANSLDMLMRGGDRPMCLSDNVDERRRKQEQNTSPENVSSSGLPNSIQQSGVWEGCM